MIDWLIVWSPVEQGSIWWWRVPGDHRCGWYRPGQGGRLQLPAGHGDVVPDQGTQWWAAQTEGWQGRGAEVVDGKDSQAAVEGRSRRIHGWTRSECCSLQVDSFLPKFAVNVFISVFTRTLDYIRPFYGQTRSACRRVRTKVCSQEVYLWHVHLCLITFNVFISVFTLD